MKVLWFEDCFYFENLIFPSDSNAQMSPHKSFENYIGHTF